MKALKVAAAMIIISFLACIVPQCLAGVLLKPLSNMGVPSSCLLKEVRGSFSAGLCAVHCVFYSPHCFAVQLKANEVCRLGSCFKLIAPNETVKTYATWRCPKTYRRVGHACYRLVLKLEYVAGAKTYCKDEADGYLSLPDTELQLRALMTYIADKDLQEPTAGSKGYNFGVFIGLVYRISKRKLLHNGSYYKRR